VSNLSKGKRDRILRYLEKLKETNIDDENQMVINDLINTITDKKYGLIWEEHEERIDSILIDNLPVFKEKKDRKISNADGSYNFLLEGDNLHSLILLEKTHRGRIDVIYIDPPYNTGNKDFIYNDSYVNLDDGYRHSKWLSFMNRRLELAKRLLSRDGIIFISIDDNEQAQLKLLCDEIFGENNFISKLTIKTGDIYGTKAAHIDKTFVKVKDYVYVYQNSTNNKATRKPLYDALPNFYDEHYTHYLKDNKIVGIVEFLKQDAKSVKAFNRYNMVVNKKNLEKIIQLDTKYKEYFINNIAHKLYKDSQFTGKLPNDIISKMVVGTPFEYYGKILYKTRGSTIRHLQSFIDVLRIPDDNTKEIQRCIPRGDLWDNFVKDMGNVGKEGRVSFKNGKKPVRLIKQLIYWANKKDGLILDFFAGSGTTGHAVMELNKEDGGNRKYILCTNNENNICEEKTYKRLSNIQTQYPHNLKYFKTDFIKKITDEQEILSGKLNQYIKELVELENMCEIDDVKNSIVFDDVDIEIKINKMDNGSNLYLPSYVLLSKDEENIILEKGINIINIPDYYFLDELIEVNEL